MKAFYIALGAVLTGAFACSTNSPIGPDAGATAGTGVPTGVAGTTGTAGTSTVGPAGTTGSAGNTGVAGTGVPTGIGGTTGAAAVGGTAGTVGTTGGCSSFGTTTRANGMCVAGAFKRNGVCTCQASQPNVCGEQCVDVLTDDNNCGCCGQACGPTSTCIQGKCGPAAVVIAPASPGCGSIDLAVAGGRLYWANKGTDQVVSMSTSGGEVMRLPGGGAPTMIAVNGKYAYWLAAGVAIVRSFVPGGTPGAIVTSATPINGFAVSADGASVYYSTGTTVMRAPSEGFGTPVLVASEEHGGIPMALALDGNILAYPTNLNGDVDLASLHEGKVASCGKEGLNGDLINVDCVRVARSQGSLFLEKIVAQQGRVLWADGTVLKMSETAPIGIPANDVVTSTLQESISGFATTANMVYFSEGLSPTDTGGVIYKAPFARDQTAIRIARGQRLPRSVVVDDKRVYWSTADCTIMSTGL